MDTRPFSCVHCNLLHPQKRNKTQIAKESFFNPGVDVGDSGAKLEGWVTSKLAGNPTQVGGGWGTSGVSGGQARARVRWERGRGGGPRRRERKKQALARFPGQECTHPDEG